MYNKDLKILFLKEILKRQSVQSAFVKSGLLNRKCVLQTYVSRPHKDLLKENEIDVNSIDLLLFRSQTPDYKIPATSPILQHRLDSLRLQLAWILVWVVQVMYTGFLQPLHMHLCRN